MAGINWLAVLVAGIASMVVGAIWYGPLFGKTWMEGMGWDTNNKEMMDKMKAAAGPGYFKQFVLSLITAGVLAYFINIFMMAWPGSMGVGLGIQAAIWIWIGFVFTVKFGDTIWSGKKLKYAWVDMFGYLASLVIMAIIISVWR